MTTAPPTGGEGRRLRRLRQLTEVPVAKLASTTDRQVADLEAIGIETVFDLLTTYPRRYLDRSRQVDLEGLFPGTEATILATVRAVRSRRTRQGKAMVELDVDDGTATVTVVFFNQPWRAKQLRAGTTALFFGKAQSYRGQVQLANPVVDVVAHDDPAAALDKMLRIVAVYPQSTKGNLTSYDLAQMVAEALDRAGQFLDPLDDVLRERLGLIDRTTAFREIHLPSSMELQAEARQRLAFDELLRLQLALGLRRQVIEREARGIVHHIEPGVFDGEVPHSLVGSLLASLPYQLTRAQRRAVEEIFDDLTAPLPMHRLLQGDVGSGKTVVALLGMLAVIDAGRQAALMAPTEVLAEQHAQSLAGLITGLSVADPSSLLGRRPLRIATLSSRLTAAQRTATLAGLAEGTIDLVVGTHALLTDEVRFAALGLAVIDEQHRFGVEQRAVLRDKGRDEGEGADPDLLVMTATPIPRTAAMVVFGDLDMTVLDELPEGRQQIHTHWASSELEVEAVWAAVRAEVAAGRQGYVVCPLVEASDKVEATSVTAEVERLAAGPLAGLRLGLLHGQMPPEQRDEAMERFRRGSLDVLVATTVIEVGVDVPNATIMVIEDAARFGIAQLHQLRGRVGRGLHQSSCYLLGEVPTPEGARRLDAMVASTDGFYLAEVDLELRGEGTILGARQQGRSDLRLASLLHDGELLTNARRVAEELTDAHPMLEGAPEVADELRLLLEVEEADFLFKS